MPLQRIKYIETNLTRKVKDLYPNNQKTLVKRIKEDFNLWIRRHNIATMAILFKMSYRFNTIFTRTSLAF